MQFLEEHVEALPQAGAYLSMHGHFYQPPREDPFTNVVYKEPGAEPYHSFNEKIAAECYGPNAYAENFKYMSFDLGPTLARWLEMAHPNIYQKILDADRWNVQRYGVGNAMAQVYNHTILPLATARDKQTQILWGLLDFKHRFGREAEGMWLAETAVDYETLDFLVLHKVKYTILAPWQIASPVDLRRPYRIALPSGRSIIAFVYNDLSGAVSYDDSWTVDANHFARSYIETYGAPLPSGAPQFHMIATDGELYGHHKPGREQFLSHLLHWSAPAYGLTMCSPARYLASVQITEDVQLHAPSSWSCHHGIARWYTSCDCTEGDGQWKSSLRQALDGLNARACTLFEAETRFKDPWAARDAYIELRNGWIVPEQFWEQHLNGGYTAEEVWRHQQLLEAQYYLQCSFTSCGFFFEDIDRIEPRNNIAFARRAISLIWLATGYDLQHDFLSALQQSRSWRTHRTGADLYASLPRIPQHLLPPTEGRK